MLVFHGFLIKKYFSIPFSNSYNRQIFSRNSFKPNIWVLYNRQLNINTKESDIVVREKIPRKKFYYYKRLLRTNENKKKKKKMI